MRRVQSSLGMRRSSSFFWTPAAHQEFERALNTLNARGAEVSAASIMTLMGLHSDLKMSDIERHLKVPTHPGAPTPAAPVYQDAQPAAALVQRASLRAMRAARRRNVHSHDTVAALAEKAAGAATGLGAAQHAEHRPARVQHRLLVATHQPAHGSPSIAHAGSVDGGCRGGARTG